jgi:ABC-type dipeptide/oligopeptide/nickel transport system permease component
VWRTAHWDLGDSYKSGQSVNDILREKTKNSLRLASWAIIIEVTVGLSVGVLAAIRRYSLADKSATVATSAASAMPVFVLGLLLQVGLVVYPTTHTSTFLRWSWIFIMIELGLAALSVLLKLIRRRPKPFGTGLGAAALAVIVLIQLWFIQYVDSHNGSPLFTSRIGPNTWTLFFIPTGDQWRYLVLPAVTLASVSTALAARMTRGSMLEVMGADYMRTARAKGLREGQIVRRHGMRNAMLPVVTLIGIDFGASLGAAVLTESVFSWPGLGQEIARAIGNRDAPVLLGLTLVVVIVYSVINLIVDISYGWFDPRVRVAGGR